MLTKRLVNRAAVRRVFHEKQARVPRGLYDQLELDVQVVLRRIADGKFEAQDAPELNGDLFIKRAPLKKELRRVLGKKRVEDRWVAFLNHRLALQVGEAANRIVALGRGQERHRGVPASVFMVFLRSKERRREGWTFERFFTSYQNEDFRSKWAGRAARGGR